MSVYGCQEQVQSTLQNTDCSYSNALESVSWDFNMYGSKRFPRKYNVEGQESFVVSLESTTARVDELQFLQKCKPTEEGAKPVPLPERIIKELGPIYYKRCKGTMKLENRTYSVTFEENSKIPQEDRDLLKTFFAKISTGMIDPVDIQNHPWSETNSIGIFNHEEGEDCFLHEQFFDFNPYLSVFDPLQKPNTFT